MQLVSLFCLHSVPSSLYVLPVHALHDPSLGSYSVLHLVHDGDDWPAVPSMQLGMAVHLMPSGLYDVPEQMEHVPSMIPFPAVHLVHDAFDWPAVPSVQFSIVVHVNPSAP